MAAPGAVDLVKRLGSDEDAVRKMAAFKLQSVVGDPSFAEAFVKEGGLSPLRFLTMSATGNTLAYALSSIARLLDTDKGWDLVTQDFISKMVEMVVTQPLVNILRGATSILVAIVAYPQAHGSSVSLSNETMGIGALKPVIGLHPDFFEMLVERLSSADHALCANSLQLINALMREAITSEGGTEWPKFIRQLQELGVIKAVHNLMQGGAIQDLAGPVLEFQGLMKMLLRRWKEVPVDIEKPEHRRAMKAIYASGKTPTETPGPNRSRSGTLDSAEAMKGSTKLSPEKWRRLGFATEQPAAEFVDVGFLGMMDLTDFIRRDEEHFHKLLIDQASLLMEKRCPIARASISVTTILYDHFDVDEASPTQPSQDPKVSTDSRGSLDRMFKPLFLQWSRLHSSAVATFFRMWSLTGAVRSDFDKIDDLVRIAVEQVVGNTSRTSSVDDVEAKLAKVDLAELRKIQVNQINESHEEAWRSHLTQMRAELRHEALEFIKEQRIRCLLNGQWFTQTPSFQTTLNGSSTDYGQETYRFIRLSHNRRHLHYADFPASSAEPRPAELSLDQLPEKIDLTTVSSVVSNISTRPSKQGSVKSASTSTVSDPKSSQSDTLITIRRPAASANSAINPHLMSKASLAGPQHTAEVDILKISPANATIASEWLDGLLMLLNQVPITAETQKLIDTITEFGLKIRMLNVRWQPGDPPEGTVIMPSREGLDDDYYYQMVGE